MSEEAQWFVMQGEEQLGPYSGAQLVEFATNGNIGRESLVWAEGMESWLPASQIEGLFPAETAPAQAAPAPMAAAGNPYGTPMAAPADPSAPYPSPEVGPGKFGLWMGLFLGGIALMLIGGLMAGLVGANADVGPDQEISGQAATGVIIASLLAMAGYLVTLLSVIPFYITLFRAWKCLQPGGMARSTPGKAIGFMFIPFFNFYWIFIAIKGLATDWNRTVTTFEDLKAAPRFSEGVFLTFCIGVFLQPLGLIMMFPVLSQMSKGVNYFCYRPKPGQSVFGGSGGTDGGGVTQAGGGLRIGGGFTKY